MKFLDALLNAKSNNKNIVIPDIKRYSPKEGELLGDRKPAEYAEMLISAGAPVLSVVTEEKEFHGSLQMLREVAAVAARHGVPVLRKDFVHTRQDLIETRECGAAAILLMCSCLPAEELKYLFREAQSLGLDVLLETHTEEDFKLVKELKAPLVGINNRDILRLERDDGNVSHTLSLLELASEEAFVVTESSITSPLEVRAAIDAGANAALVGTALLRAENAGAFYNMLTSRTALKICGLMNRHDIELCVNEGVERIGLVTEYPIPVPWNLTADEAEELRSFIPSGHQAVLVTGGSPEKILSLAEKVRPDMVQLHYSESLEETALLASQLKEMGISVIRTIPVKEEAYLSQFGKDSLEETVKAICETDVSEILVDPRHGKDVARNDLHADVELFRKIKGISTVPVILAGGVTSENAREMLSLTGARSVDIMTGSEDRPGAKSKDKIRKIVRTLQ